MPWFHFPIFWGTLNQHFVRHGKPDGISNISYVFFCPCSEHEQERLILSHPTLHQSILLFVFAIEIKGTLSQYTWIWRCFFWCLLCFLLLFLNILILIFIYHHLGHLSLLFLIWLKCHPELHITADFKLYLNLEFLTGS